MITKPRLALLALELVAIVGGLIYLITILSSSPASPTQSTLPPATIEPTTQPAQSPTRPHALVFPTIRGGHHQTGHAAPDGWTASPSDRTNVYLNYGPYTRAVPPGPAIATFRLKIDDVTKDNATVVNLDINDNRTSQQLGDLSVTRQQFNQPNIYQDFQIPFTAPPQGSLEFRTWYFGQCTVTQQSVTITPQR